MCTKKTIITLAILFLFGCTTTSAPFFDANGAMQKAGSLINPGQDNFFMFYVPENAPLEPSVTTVQHNLIKAAKAKAAVAIVGPNFPLNYQILNNALTKFNSAELQGAEIIFIGNKLVFPELEKIATSKGAAFKATSYP